MPKPTQCRYWRKAQPLKFGWHLWAGADHRPVYEMASAKHPLRWPLMVDAANGGGLHAAAGGSQVEGSVSTLELSGRFCDPTMNTLEAERIDKRGENTSAPLQHGRILSFVGITSPLPGTCAMYTLIWTMIMLWHARRAAHGFAASG